MKGKVLIAAPVHEVLTTGLENEGYELLRYEQITQELAMQLISECVGVITSTRLQLNKQLIDAATQLEFIARMGSGMELIDIPYAISKGIRCISSPEGNANAVAEHALGMLLALNKKIIKSNIELREGHWIREENRGTELEGKTMGIIGYGHTGKAFARLLRGFDMRILVYDKYITVQPESHIIVCHTIQDIQKEAEIISLHVPYQEDTFHLVDEAFIQAMKKPFILINTSRGTVVDSTALTASIRTGNITGLALDVWEEEPLEKMSSLNRNTFNELVLLPNVIITPHIAGYSFEALYKMSLVLFERIMK